MKREREREREMKIDPCVITIIELIIFFPFIFIYIFFFFFLVFFRLVSSLLFNQTIETEYSVVFLGPGFLFFPVFKSNQFLELKNSIFFCLIRQPSITFLVGLNIQLNEWMNIDSSNCIVINKHPNTEREREIQCALCLWKSRRRRRRVKKKHPISINKFDQRQKQKTRKWWIFKNKTKQQWKWNLDGP